MHLIQKKILKRLKLVIHFFKKNCHFLHQEVSNRHLSCPICKKLANSKKQQQQHFKSKGHAEKLDEIYGDQVAPSWLTNQSNSKMFFGSKKGKSTRKSKKKKIYS